MKIPFIHVNGLHLESDYFALLLKTSCLDWYDRVWESFLAILVIYTAWASPFELAFLDKPRRLNSVLDNVVNGFFAIDVILIFFVAYLDKSTYLLVDDHRKIARKYATSWLAFDVISTIPPELVWYISPRPLRLHDLFNMLRLWRLRRVNALFTR